ncbi:MAG TPA: 16S rRNA (guanine(966)-N(2))-methyltransferase RsmD [Desulfobulbus sp.]|nr:16S rRNA (guanine(966)-N(2))-methyltransferase RsmD [Desulfobulbus sp.]
MRITGGRARGHRLVTPGTRFSGIRPTSDRIREALFSILDRKVRDALVLDLFAGTGALGMEALSRGARHCVFVDRSARALDLIRTNLQRCFPNPAASVFRGDLTRPGTLAGLAARMPGELLFDLVFLDPPYKKNLAQQALEMVDKPGILAPGAMVVAEEERTQELPEALTRLRLIDRRRYGGTGLWIYSHGPYSR